VARYLIEELEHLEVIDTPLSDLFDEFPSVSDEAAIV
jgi:hypothetical protein